MRGSRAGDAAEIYFPLPWPRELLALFPCCFASFCGLSFFCFCGFCFAAPCCVAEVVVAVCVVAAAVVDVTAHVPGVSPCAVCAGTAGVAMTIVCDFPDPVL